MNNLYSDTLDNATVTSLFTDESRTTVAPDAITKMRLAIIDSMVPDSTADPVTVAQIVNSLTLYAYSGRPSRRFKLRAPSNLEALLQSTVDIQQDNIEIRLSTSSLFVNPDDFNPISFSGISIHPLPAVAAITVGTAPTTTAAAATATATATATAANAAVAANAVAAASAA